MKQLKKLKTRPVSEDETYGKDDGEFSWGDPEEFSWDTEEEVTDELTGKAGRRGQRFINVSLAYNAVGLDQSDMFMEIAASRGTIPEAWDLARWSEYLHTVGNVPFYIACGDVDRFHMLIYASEILRKNPDYKDVGLSKLRGIQTNYDAEKEWAKSEGTVWGGVDPQPVREQVAAQKKNLIDSTRSEAVRADTVTSHEAQEDAYLAKWIKAEKYARAKRDTWEGKFDWEFEQMIKYCYAWLEDIGEVPEYPSEQIDLFWPAPTPAMIHQDKTTVERRNYVTGKVIRYWQKALSDKSQPYDRESRSYRKILVAQKLSKKIEDYATNHQTDPEGLNDQALLAKVKRYAMMYVDAHLPVSAQSKMRGPDWVVDPDYVTYVKLCKKYNIEVGTLLHQATI